MKRGLIRVTIGFFAIVPFVVASCMMNDTEDIPDFTEQLQKDLATIDSYLAANNITAQSDVDGLIRYVILRDSAGDHHATIDSCVTANYSGLLLADGQEFDDGVAISFPLNGVIDGWKVGIPLLSVGDSATLYIPSGLAYGYYGIEPDIPKNANLIFNVGVIKVGTTYRISNGVSSCN